MLSTSDSDRMPAKKRRRFRRRQRDGANGGLRRDRHRKSRIGSRFGWNDFGQLSRIRRVGIPQGFEDRKCGFFRHDELRHVAALWDGDPDPVRSSLGQVVVLQAAAEPTSFNPDHRVGHGVEAWITVEGVNRDGVGFDPVGAPGKGLLHDVLQEAPLPFGVA